MKDNVPTCASTSTSEQLYKHPECFTPEDNNPYPLCTGKNSPECKSCCLYVKMDGEGGLD